MPNITCVKCNESREAMAGPPMPTDLGKKIHGSICPACWQEWMGMSTKIINEYRLQLFRPEHRQSLEEQMRLFLNLQQ